jgi:hypothetical protein
MKYSSHNWSGIAVPGSSPSRCPLPAARRRSACSLSLVLVLASAGRALLVLLFLLFDRLAAISLFVRR